MPVETPVQNLTVSELNAYIKSCLEGDPFLSSVYLRAEISNFKSYPNGHCYFTLKDDKSTISAVMWATYSYRLSFRPKDGDEVLVHGRISAYPPRGSYQIAVDDMQMFGRGAELLRLQQLKAKLAAEGLFDASRKRRLPSFPQRVGVIAGKDSAGLRDIVVNLSMRWPLAELVIMPALVQGKEAPKSIMGAFENAQKQSLDVLIIARGGGSSEDLSAFNDEALVRLVATSHCPVIAAVGHEVDVTLIDLVADLRVSTPTAAAVAAVPDKNEIIQYLDEAGERLIKSVNGLLSDYSTRLRDLSHRAIFVRPESIYADKIAGLDLIARRLDLALAHRLSEKTAAVAHLSAKLEALNPRQVLKRGYSMTTDEEGRPIASVADAAKGQTMRTHLDDGIIVSTITGSEKGES